MKKNYIELKNTYIQMTKHKKTTKGLTKGIIRMKNIK